MDDLLYFSILSKFSLVNIYYFNILKVFLKDDEVNKTEGSSFKETRVKKGLLKLHTKRKMSGS